MDPARLEAVDATAGDAVMDVRCRRILDMLLPEWLDRLVPEDAPHRLPLEQDQLEGG